MPDWRGLARERLAGLGLEGAREAEVAEELSEDMEERYQALVASGLSGAEAEARAREVLDRCEQLAEELRRRDRSRRESHSPFAGAAQDLRLAFRNLRARPGFSAMAIGMLALGIAGNTAIFSIFDGMFLRPLPFRDPSRLVALDETAPQWHLKSVGIDEVDFAEWRKQNSTFDSMAVFDDTDFNLSGFGPAQRVHGAAVTRDMLGVLRLQPLMGRNFSALEASPHGPKAVLLGYGLWQRLFHGDRGVVGRAVDLSNEPYTVIGVLPREAVFPDRVDLWVALQIAPSPDNGWYLNGVGRMKAGVSTGQAGADLLRIHKTLISGGRKVNEITSPTVAPLRDPYLRDFRLVSGVLLGAVGLVLLIACVNIGALMLVRATARANEIAIRTAIGASPGRIVRQLFTENLVMAAIGGAAGVGLGYLLLGALVGMMPEDELPQWLSFGIDGRFAAFCVLITGGSAVLFGLAPALQAARADSGASLHDAGARVSLSRRSRRLLHSMVVCEIGLALMLAVSAALLAQAFQRVLNTDPGFRPENVLTFGVELPEAGYAKPGQRLEFFGELVARLRVLPGVASVGAASAPPLGGHWGNFFVAEGGRPVGPKEENPVVLQVAATPGYFDAIGLTLLAGRKFEERDNTLRVKSDSFTALPGPLAAIVNETFARRYWPVADAPGKRISHSYKGAVWITVIGVAKDVRHYGLDQPVRPTVYFPYGEAPRSAMSIVMRGPSDPEALIAPARRALLSVDPAIPMFEPRTMTSRIDESLWARRAYSWLFIAFAVVALALASAGVYGVVSYAVTRRTREIGIRMALGARPGQVVGEFVRSGMILVVVGTGAGLAATLFAARSLESLLFGVRPGDPVIYATVALGIAAVCLLANWIPARRAASIDPLSALRGE